MKFFVELYGVNDKAGYAEEVEADYYKKENGFVTFYQTVSEPTQTEGGLILSLSEKTVDQIIIDYNERQVRFITPDYTSLEKESNF